jgi:hypothetical protein
MVSLTVRLSALRFAAGIAVILARRWVRRLLHVR